MDDHPSPPPKRKTAILYTSPEATFAVARDQIVQMHPDLKEALQSKQSFLVSSRNIKAKTTDSSHVAKFK